MFSTLHQDQHPKSLVRLRVCPSEPIKRERKEKEGEKKKEKKKKEHGVGLKLGSSCSQTVSLTIRPWEHEATGLTEHKHTYIHVLSYGGPKKMAAIPEVFALFWEKTSELSDGYCFKL